MESVEDFAKRLIRDARRAGRLPRQPSAESTARVAAILRSAMNEKSAGVVVRRKEVAAHARNRPPTE